MLLPRLFEPVLVRVRADQQLLALHDGVTLLATRAARAVEIDARDAVIGDAHLVHLVPRFTQPGVELGDGVRGDLGVRTLITGGGHAAEGDHEGGSDEAFHTWDSAEESRGVAAAPAATTCGTNAAPAGSVARRCNSLSGKTFRAGLWPNSLPLPPPGAPLNMPDSFI